MSEPQPQPQQQQATHVLVSVETISKVSRLLTRLALDGQEAAELVQALGQSQLVTPTPVEPTEDPKEDHEQEPAPPEE